MAASFFNARKAVAYIPMPGKRDLCTCNITVATAVAGKATELHRTTTIGGEVYGSGGLHEISRSGTIVASAAQNLCNSRIDPCTDDRVLVGLAELILKLRDLRILGGQLLLYEEVHQTPIVGVLVIDDVACLHVDAGAQIVEALGRVVVYAVNGTLSFAAAVADLVTNLVKTALHVIAQIADRIVYTVETGRNAVVQRVGAVGNTLLDASHAALEVIEVEAALEISEAETTAETAAKASATTKQQDKDQKTPNAAIAAETAKHTASATIVAVVGFATKRITHAKIIH
mgnify:CR=1 FL=1